MSAPADIRRRALVGARDGARPGRYSRRPSRCSRWPTATSACAANLDEGEPFGLPGTYLNSFYELRPLPHAEVGYGYPESGQTLVNVTDGKIIRLLVDDEPFDVRYGELLSHERELDLRAGRPAPHRRMGVARRATAYACARRGWSPSLSAPPPRSSTRSSPSTGRCVSSSSRSSLPTSRVPLRSGDPRAAALLDSPLQSEEHSSYESRVVLVHSTRLSELRLAAAMDHLVDGPEDTETSTETAPDVGRVTIAGRSRRGRALRVVKFLAYGCSSQRSLPAVSDHVVAALAEARHTGWDGLLASQRAYLDDFWDRADVELEGDPELQQAIRFALFHTLQAGARAEQRAIGAKGLTGPGYDGHTFWDSERFVLPVLTYTAPRAAGDALRWRHTTLDLARERATQLGLARRRLPMADDPRPGVLGLLARGTAAFHIGADIADAVVRYQQRGRRPGLRAGGGSRAARRDGSPLALAGPPRRAGPFPDRRRDRPRRVQRDRRQQRLHQPDGPAEPRRRCRRSRTPSTPCAGSRSRLRGGGVLAARCGDHDRPVGRSARRPPSVGGLHRTPGSGTSPAPRPAQYPLLLHVPYFDLYRKQVVKQADLVLALHARGDAFTAEEKARDFAYYEALTVRDSSLSACTQAVIAAEVGHLELAYDYFGEAALMDLHDLEHNTLDGVHIASLAGAWIAAVAGFGGMRDHDGKLTFAPRLPPGSSAWPSASPSAAASSRSR